MLLCSSHQGQSNVSQHYRLWLIWLLPSLRHLDFIRVRQAERDAARELFGESFTAQTDTAKKILASTKTGRPLPTGDDDEDGAPAKRRKLRLTDEERAGLEKMVREAKSLREIERLERALAEGRMPA